MTTSTHSPHEAEACQFCEQVIQRNQELEEDKSRLLDQLDAATALLEESDRRKMQQRLLDHSA